MFQKSLKISLLLLVIAAGKVNAQNVAINEDGTTADASALLDVKSNKAGVLLPRLTKVQRNAIAKPAAGLLIYQTDDNAGFYYYQGNTEGGWIRLATGSAGATGNGWALNGNYGTGGSAFFGTTDHQELIFKANNQQVGRLGVPGSTGAIAFGNQANAGSNATALGTGAQATANESVALGTNAKSSVQQGIAIGYLAEASGNNEVIAIGSGAKAQSYRSLAVGAGAVATGGDQATALGVNAQATAYQSVAIGPNAKATQQGAIILGGNDAQVGIGTTAPKQGAKLDVNGAYKLGVQGSVLKNVVTGIDNNGYKSVPAGGYLDYEVLLTGPVSSMQASVAVSPGIDLPAGVSIAYARLTALNKVKIRFVNANPNTGNTALATFNGNLYITVTEF